MASTRATMTGLSAQTPPSAKCRCRFDKWRRAQARQTSPTPLQPVLPASRDGSQGRQVARSHLPHRSCRSATTRFPFFAENSWAQLFRPCLSILNRLGVDAQFPAQFRDRSLRSFGSALTIAARTACVPSQRFLRKRLPVNGAWRSYDEFVP